MTHFSTRKLREDSHFLFMIERIETKIEFIRTALSERQTYTQASLSFFSTITCNQPLKLLLNMGPAPHVMVHVPESPETRHQIGRTTYDNARHAPDGNLSALTLLAFLFIFLIFQALLNLYRATHLTCEARSTFAAFIKEPPFCAPLRSYSCSTSRKSRPRSNND